ncbi:MAG: hypothetical protein H6706_01515 [Myxococcales bacterium]|nr:hypothetical protein [Myxococcales bacterium]
MKAEILSRTEWLQLPLVAVVLFVAIFVLMLAWIVRPGASRFYAMRGRMALDDGEVRGE